MIVVGSARPTRVGWYSDGHRFSEHLIFGKGRADMSLKAVRSSTTGLAGRTASLPRRKTDSARVSSRRSRNNSTPRWKPWRARMGRPWPSPGPRLRQRPGSREGERPMPGANSRIDLSRQASDPRQGRRQGDILVEFDRTVSAAERNRVGYELLRRRLDAARLVASRCGLDSSTAVGFAPPAGAPDDEVARTRVAMLAQAIRQRRPRRPRRGRALPNAGLVDLPWPASNWGLAPFRFGRLGIQRDTNPASAFC